MLSTRFTKHSLVTEAHKTIQPYLSNQSFSIDATMGNGHDTLFLAQHSHKVYAFDIQESALKATRQRLENKNCLNKVSLIHAGHQDMLNYVTPKQKADVIMFNLGYLPHAEKSIITQTVNTLAALNHAIKLLSPNGIISILAYPGHSGGDDEMQAVIRWHKKLENTQYAITIIHSMHENEHSPRLFIIQKSLETCLEH